MKLRNQTFVCTAKVKNMMKPSKSGAKTIKIMSGILVHYENVTNHLRLTRK